jgi:hypothetical protein
MDSEKAKRFIIENVAVTRQKVGIAKRYVLNHFNANTTELLDAFGRQMDASITSAVVVAEDGDTTTPDLKKVAEALTWRLAACEAIWGLVHANLLLPSQDHFDPITSITWTTSRNSVGIDFRELCVPVPGHVMWAPSQHCRERQSLSDADLYLQELNIPGLHPTVEQALREAVHCFRHELYLASLAMLGRACEGTWTELGLSLARAAMDLGYSRAEKLREMLVAPKPGIAAKIDEVVKLYSGQKALFRGITEDSEIKLYELESARTWTDLVRESRNSIHYGTEASMSNSYEKVAVLLIAAVTHLKTLYRLIQAANKASGI